MVNYSLTMFVLFFYFFIFRNKFYLKKILNILIKRFFKILKILKQNIYRQFSNKKDLKTII